MTKFIEKVIKMVRVFILNHLNRKYVIHYSDGLFVDPIKFYVFTEISTCVHNNKIAIAANRPMIMGLDERAKLFVMTAPPRIQQEMLGMALATAASKTIASNSDDFNNEMVSIDISAPMEPPQESPPSGSLLN